MQKKGFVYHLVLPEVWERALIEERYRPASLKSEGFIHLSTEAQLFETAKLYFEGRDELVALRLIVKRLGPALKWEPSRNDELFPHLYAEIPWEAIENTIGLERQEDGTFQYGN